MFVIDNLKIIHKASVPGDHSYFGGVGLTKKCMEMLVSERV